MAKYLFIFLISIFLFSCGSDTQQTQTVQKGKSLGNKIPSEIQGVTNKESNIKFDFSLSNKSSVKGGIKVKASLLNEGSETVYLLTTTCDGEQHSLQFDSVNFDLIPLILCKASRPKVVKIAPGAQHDFYAHFKSKAMAKNLKLGFDFTEVDQSFDINAASVADINAKAVKNKHTLWATTKQLPLVP